MMLQMETTEARQRHAAAPTVFTAGGCLVLSLMLGGCATQSVGELPLLQETIDGRCAGGAVKECRVWGGNKFRKRYEYCGCRES